MLQWHQTDFDISQVSHDAWNPTHPLTHPPTHLHREVVVEGAGPLVRPGSGVAGPRHAQGVDAVTGGELASDAGRAIRSHSTVAIGNTLGGKGGEGSGGENRFVWMGVTPSSH